jgi:hypothetical protein
MADGGGSVTCEGSGDDLFIHASEVERRFASQSRWQGHSMGVVRRRRVRRVRRLRQWPGGGKVGACGHSARLMATARVARGARGVGEKGGAAQGGPTARRPADQGRPRRAGREGNAAGMRAAWLDGTLWTPRAKNRSD